MHLTLSFCRIMCLLHSTRRGSVPMRMPPHNLNHVQAREVVLQGRPPIRWDVLSINVGITPDTSSVPGAGDYTIPIKPVSRCAFLKASRVRCSST